MFLPINPRRHRNAPVAARAFAAVVGIAAAIFAKVALNARDQGTHAPWPWISVAIAGTIVALAFVVLVRALLSRAKRRAESDEAREHADHSRHLVLLVIVIVTSLIVLALVLALTPRAAASQEPSGTVQSAYIVTRGSDTLVVERVTRGRSSIAGEITIKAQARMTFNAELATGPSIPSLSYKGWTANAAPDAPPLQSGVQTLTPDSVIMLVEARGEERRFARAVTGNPLPIINNEFAMFELGIARARALGTTAATIPMFALSGGVQLDVTYQFISTDSCVVRIAGQETRFAIDRIGRIIGGIVPSQNVFLSRVDGPAVTRISIGRPDYSAPADAPYLAEEVTVKTPAGHVLTGTLTRPTNTSGRVPAVVTITGSGQQDRDEYISIVPNYRLFRQVADTLGRRGIAVLRLDDRAINGSGGDAQKATSADFADDIRAGIAFLRARADIDGGRIALVGHSEGGMIAPLVASTDLRLAGIVLMAGPAFTGRRILDFQITNGVMGSDQIPAASKDSAIKALMTQFDSTSAKLPWMQYFLAYDPLPTARKVKVPVLILQGGSDQQVTPDQAPELEHAFKSGGNKDVTMRVFADYNHLFLYDPNGFPGGYVKLPNGKVDGEVMGTLAEWLVARLKP